jgi:ribosomal protein S18 acetylase RimI-like enzyme
MCAALTVRQAVLADLDALAALFDEYRQFQGRPTDVGAARAFLKARFDHGESVVFLACDGDGDGERRPGGFAQLYPSFSSVSLSRVFVLNDLFVTASFRRRGAASALLRAVEAYAWAMGAARITLNVARENVQAQALYKAEGWVWDEQFHMLHRFPG